MAPLDVLVQIGRFVTKIVAVSAGPAALIGMKLFFTKPITRLNWRSLGQL